MRREFSQYKGQRHKFVATVSRFGRLWTTGMAYTKTVMVVDVQCTTLTELNTDHLWLIQGVKLEELRPKIGERIQFEGLIKPYAKGITKNKTDYGLEKCKNFRLLP